MMNALKHLSRRSFLKHGAAGAGGLVLGVSLASSGRIVDEVLGDSDSAGNLNLFVQIAENGDVVITAMSPEIGQGARTAMPTIVADELEADWSRVSIVQAGPNPGLGDQGVGGSSAIRDNWDNLRLAGATARTMLEMAAAQVWGVNVSACNAANHRVIHRASGRALGFGELANIASGLEMPAADAVQMKNPDQYRYIGGAVATVDAHDMVMGRAIYSIDTMRPGMKFAMVERSPVVGGRVASFNGDAALAVPGVEAVFPIGEPIIPTNYHTIGGIAVVANSTWAAIKGREALEITWEDGPNANYNTIEFGAALRETVANDCRVVRSAGDVAAGMEGAAQTLTADYFVPHQAHATMEPPAAVADVAGDRAELWTATQDPQGCHDFVSQVLGLPKENVTVHVMLAGGGFGRKSKIDFAVEAALISREIGAPVKVIWTREDDIRHGFYHASCAQHLEAGLDEEGKPVAWLHRSAFPSIKSTFAPQDGTPLPFELGLGFVDMPYDIPNIRCESGDAMAHVRIGWFRSVCNINHAFAIGSFMDELAHAAGRDPADFIIDSLGPDRNIDLSDTAIANWNYGTDVDVHPRDTGRMAQVVRKVRAASNWGTPQGSGDGIRRGRGIALHRSFLTYVATVVEVEIDSDGMIKIPRVDYAVDCGTIVNTDRVTAQFEGGAIYGISMALYGEITAENGRIQQSNYHDYEMTRMDMSPQVHVHLTESTARPTGVGEPPVPPVAPALCNAIFAATGKRIRQLPIATQLTDI